MPPARTIPEPEEADAFGPPTDHVDFASEDEEDDGGAAVYKPLECLPDVHYHRRTVGDLMGTYNLSEAEFVLPEPVMPEGTYGVKLVRDIVEMLQTPYLDLDPEYQRDVVWTADRMTKLVNSIMSNYYIPPLIFNCSSVNTPEGARFMRTAIDGKQRLSSIREFVAGRLPCSDANGKRWYYTAPPPSSNKARYARILPLSARRAFERREIICTEFSDLDQAQQEDLFSRVQLGIPLTPAEKLRATTGPWREFAVELGKRYGDLMDLVDNKRGRAFQLTLSILRMMHFADTDDVAHSSSASTLKTFAAKTKFDEATAAHARRVFKVYDAVLRHYPETFQDNSYSHSKKFSPVEFVAVATLIHKNPSRTPGLLAGDIKDMRMHLRYERQDLRSNTETWKAVKGWIDNLEKHRGGPGVLPVRPGVLAVGGNAPTVGREGTVPLFAGSPGEEDDAMSEYGTPAPSTQRTAMYPTPGGKRKMGTEEALRKIKRERKG